MKFRLNINVFSKICEVSEIKQERERERKKERESGNYFEMTLTVSLIYSIGV